MSLSLSLSLPLPPSLLLPSSSSLFPSPSPSLCLSLPLSFSLRLPPSFPLPVTLPLPHSQGNDVLGLGVGMVLMWHSLGGLVGSSLGGVLFDKENSYKTAVLVCVAVCLVAFICVVIIPEPLWRDQKGKKKEIDKQRPTTVGDSDSDSDSDTETPVSGGGSNSSNGKGRSHTSSDSQPVAFESVEPLLQS